MAARGWTAQVAAAAGAAAGTGAAQLGLGYGLGVVVWPAAGTADDSVWLGSLGWATWIAASATVFGAVIGGRAGRTTGGPWRFALAASAAVGALLTVVLVALPARAAVRPDTFSPQTIAAGYAAIGVLLGLGIAYWAVVSRPVAANLLATAGWLWALAVAAVASDIFWNRPSAAYPSSWQFASAGGGLYGTIYWPSAILTLLAAFLVGVLGAWPAVRRGNHGLGTASSGAVGPLLVAGAFLVLAPQLTRSVGPLESAYLIAPYAVLTGLAGSAAAVAAGQQIAARRRQATGAAEIETAAAGVVAVPAQRPASSNEPKSSAGAVAAREQRPAVDPHAVATGRAKAPSPVETKPARGRQSETAAGEPRSTVARPPASPSVAQINPPKAPPTPGPPTGTATPPAKAATPPAKAAMPAARTTPAAGEASKPDKSPSGSVAAKGAAAVKRTGAAKKAAPRQDG